MPNTSVVMNTVCGFITHVPIVLRRTIAEHKPPRKHFCSQSIPWYDDIKKFLYLVHQ